MPTTSSISADIERFANLSPEEQADPAEFIIHAENVAELASLVDAGGE